MFSFQQLQFLLENYQERLAQRGVSQDIIDYIDTIKNTSKRGQAISKAMSNPRLTLQDIRPPIDRKHALFMINERLWKQVVDADPTKENDYFDIIMLWANGAKWIEKENRWAPNARLESIRLPEDAYRVREVLEYFNKNKTRFKTKYINRYRTFQELEQEYLDVSGKKSKRQEIRDMKMKGAKKIYDVGGNKIYKITSEEAACYYGAGTRWCTASTNGYNYADDYIQDTGALYIWIDTKSNRKWQADGNFDQVMDEEDNTARVGDKQDFLEMAAEAGVEAALISIYDSTMPQYIRPDGRLEKQLLDIAKKSSPEKAAKLASIIFEARYNYGKAVTINQHEQWENMVLNSIHRGKDYVSNYVEKESKSLERKIKASGKSSWMVGYCQRISLVHGNPYRVPEFEKDIISKGEEVEILRYALHCVGGRWKEAEERLKTGRRHHWMQYMKKVIKGPLPMDKEDILETNPNSMYTFATEVAKGRVKDYEEIIDKNTNSYLERYRNSIFAVTNYLIKFNVEIDSYLNWLVTNSGSFGVVDYVTEVYGRKMPEKVEDAIFEDFSNGMKYTMEILRSPLTAKQEIKYFNGSFNDFHLDRFMSTYVLPFKRELPLKVLSRHFDNDRLGPSRLLKAAHYSVYIGKKFPIPSIHDKIMDMEQTWEQVREYQEAFGD